MRLELTTRFGGETTHGEVTITDTGVAVLTQGQGDDIEEAIVDAMDTRHGGIQGWVPVLQYLTNWCDARDLKWVVRDRPPTTPVNPDVDY